MGKREKVYFKSLLVVTIVLAFLFLISMIYSVKILFELQNINSCIFELLYAAFHLIVLGLAIVLIIQTFKEGSFIIKGLTTEGNGKVVNKKSQIIALIIANISSLVFIYFFLVFLGVNLPYFNFPVILILILINVSLFGVVYGVYFYIYPNILMKDKK